jgi:hypothetical protein
MDYSGFAGWAWPQLTLKARIARKLAWKIREIPFFNSESKYFKFKWMIKLYKIDAIYSKEEDILLKEYEKLLSAKYK